MRDADVIDWPCSSLVPKHRMVTDEMVKQVRQALSSLMLLTRWCYRDSWPCDNSRWTCLWKNRCSPLCRCQYPWCGFPYFNHRPNQCPLPYIEALAGKGFAQAIAEDEGLASRCDHLSKVTWPASQLLKVSIKIKRQSTNLFKAIHSIKRAVHIWTAFCYSVSSFFSSF